MNSRPPRGPKMNICLLTLLLFLSFFMFHGTYAIEGEEENKDDVIILKKPNEVVLRILLAKIKNDLRVSSPGGIKIKRKGLEGEIFLDSSSTYTFRARDEKLELLDKENSGDFELGNEITISSLNPSAILKINEKRYRGKLRVFVKDGFKWLVNLVPLEEYLYGVIPLEFKTRYPELAKAQAMVARTYALGHRGRYEKYGFDFTSGVRFQLYGGFDVEDITCNEAVTATRGQVLLYDGKLARYPLYHSTCGGRTADNESVFLTNPLPYLRSEKCDGKLRDVKPESGEGTNGDKKEKEKNSTKFLDQGEKKEEESGKEKSEEENPGDINFDVNPPSHCARSRYYRWEVCWTNDELSKIINRSFRDDETGTIRDIQIKKRGKSGRVVVLVIITDKGEFRVRGDEIRRTLRFKNKKGKMMNLYSTRFNIGKQEKDEEIIWVAKGSGWGHGIGMCQFGALKMAKEGAAYRQILKKYYHGVTTGDYNRLPEFEGTNSKKE